MAPVAAVAAATEAPATILAGPGEVFETTFQGAKRYDYPFVDIEVDVVFRLDDQRWKVPAFWNGPQQWTVRFAPPQEGLYRYRVHSSDASHDALNRIEGALQVGSIVSENALQRRGALQISDDHRHFVHAEGTPFLWLGDTWWKNLCKRLSWQGFQELTADRKAKGYNVVQIVWVSICNATCSGG